MYICNKGERSVALSEIPTLEYPKFLDDAAGLLERPECHCVNYFAVPTADGSGLTFYCLVADDSTAEVYILSHTLTDYDKSGLPSLTARVAAMHIFEREIFEAYGIFFNDHPWLKPVRTSADKYPFYYIDGHALHEVNVGPIHAGIIEPGAFRFICNGERVLHLEIALGYQHRGIESLMVQTDSRLRQSLLAESIAGDTAVGHASAFAAVVEEGRDTDPALATERLVAQELERLAMHIADTGALCMDIGYQLGQVASEALRTIVINSTQMWCGNRFGKGAVRQWGTNFPLTRALADKIAENIRTVRGRYSEVVRDLTTMSSVLSRFEETGIVTRAQALRVGAVGMSARMAGVRRDVRWSHPAAGQIAHTPVLHEGGDVMSRLLVRTDEAMQSIDYILAYLSGIVDSDTPRPNYHAKMTPQSLVFSLVEGWRGEICHAAVTGPSGEIVHYKIKDPSLHNWMVLALAVRNQQISDFPICNKSFNLSYCGADL